MPSSALLAPVATSNIMPNELNSLTDIEIQIITLIAQGLKDEEISSRIKFDGLDLDQIIASIYAKLGVADRLELIIYAIYHGIVVLPH
jgi:two-component system, NarL family, nitrate/nitrite response regulator NarL